MRRLRLSADLAILVALMLISGCGGVAPVNLPKTVPFTGTVKLDGKPLAGARVVFMPVSDKMYEADGVTNDAGAYALSVTVGAEHAVGATPGNYKVRITRLVAPDGTPQDTSKPTEVPGKETVPDRYSDSATTGLTATVGAGAGTQDFDLSSKP